MFSKYFMLEFFTETEKTQHKTFIKHFYVIIIIFLKYYLFNKILKHNYWYRNVLVSRYYMTHDLKCRVTYNIQQQHRMQLLIFFYYPLTLNCYLEYLFFFAFRYLFCT